MTDSAHSDQTELERVLRKGKPWLEENATALIYLLAAVLAVAAVVVYMNRQPAGDADASYELLLANTREEFRDVADAYPETSIGIWARLHEADDLLSSGLGNLFTDRAKAEEELEDAENAYNRLIERSDLTLEIRERILIGLAKLAEARNDGSQAKVDAAVEAWQLLLTSFPDSMMKAHAEDRIERLKTEDSKAFYAWFSQQKPTPAAEATGSDPLAPAVPQVPDLEELLKGAGLPPGETPSASTELPGSEDETATPADPAPASEDSSDDSAESESTSDAPAADSSDETKPATEEATESPAAPTETSADDAAPGEADAAETADGTDESDSTDGSESTEAADESADPGK